jgi:hypothetical protein
MASEVIEYGPFHRLRNGTTQSDDVAEKQQRSQEIWGVAARWSNLRAVKAYRGALPPGAEGIEFMTTVPPTRLGPFNAFWYEGAASVSINREEFAVIKVRMTKRVP